MTLIQKHQIQDASNPQTRISDLGHRVHQLKGSHRHRTINEKSQNHYTVGANKIHQARAGSNSASSSRPSKNTEKLIQDQCVATSEIHPETLIWTGISHGEMLGIVKYEKMYWKRNHNAEAINLINNYLTDAHKAALEEQEEGPIKSDIFELGVDKKIQAKIRNIFQKYERLCSGSLGRYQQLSTASISSQAHVILNRHLIGPNRKQEISTNLKLRSNFSQRSLNHPTQGGGAHAIRVRKNGRLRFYIHYRKLSTKTAKTSTLFST